MPEVFVNRVTQDSSSRIRQTGLAVEIDDKSKRRITGLPLGSGDLLSLQPYFSFHGGLSPQALQIARDGYDSKSATAFLVCHGTVALIEAPIDLDSLPLLGVAHIVDSHVVVLTPEEWNSVKLFATAKNIPGRYLTLALSNHPVLDANSLAGMRIGPAGGIASCEDSSHAGFEVFVDFDTPIDREPSLLGQNQRRPHAYTQNQEVCV